MTDSSGETGRRLWRSRLYPALPIAVWLLLTVGISLLFPRTGSFRFSEYQVGSVSKEEIIAPFSFEILKSESELESEREAARKSIEPVFSHTDSVAEMQLDKLDRFLVEAKTASDSINIYRRQGTANLDSIRMAFWQEQRSAFSLNLTFPSWDYLMRSLQGKAFANRIRGPNGLQAILRDIFAHGVLDRSAEKIITSSGRVRVISDGEERSVQVSTLTDIAGARRDVLTRLEELAAGIREVQSDSLIKVGYELLVPFIRPNLVYDSEETEERRKAVIDKVPLVKGIVLKDERIIDSNEKFTREHLDILRSMEMKRAELAAERGILNRVYPWLGRLLLPGGLLLVFGFWLSIYRKDIFFRTNHLLLVTSLVALLVAVYGIFFPRFEISPYLFPAAIGAIILTIVFDGKVAFFFSVLVALLIGALTGNDYYTMLAVFLPSFAAIYAVIRVRTRVQIMRSALLIFGALIVIIIAQRTLTYQMDLDIFGDFLYAAINGLAAALIALGGILAVEAIFSVTTDLTLLELGDLNRPLLKLLSLEAPGTYHHSIMVGNLAEAAAEAIDANPLLVRAGAYYHDIGKMVRRDYFVENQFGSKNIHDDLTPEESAEFLRDHVIDGVKLANRYHLPEAIKDFIREHHGTQLMSFFYSKAMETSPDRIDESKYRYPGPKPQSKETAILMLADGAEAATRSAEDPSKEKISENVRELVINKYLDKELDECPLTLNDLRRVTEAFVPILEGMHHHRIRYPSREQLERKRAEKEAGESGEKSDR